MTLRGASTVVTGGGRGIGRAIALALATQGARVALAARHAEEIESVLAEIRALGGEGLAAPCDVSRAAEVEALFCAAAQAHGPIDLLVNNAGVVARVELAAMPEADWDRVLDVNLKGAYLCCRAALAGEAGMIARRRGRIVNVASISATVGTPKLTAYCASKWGLLGLTKALAEELRESGISVTAVLPGSVDTEMLRGSGFEPAMPPETVAQVVRFLAGDAPFAMTGAGIEVYG